MAVRYAGRQEREEQKQAVKQIERALDPKPPYVTNQKASGEGLRQRLHQEKDRLNKITPPDIRNDKQRRKVVNRLKILETALIEGNRAAGIEPMPTRQEMWDATSANIGKHAAWETKWKTINVDDHGKPYAVDTHKGEHNALDDWKDLRRILYKEDEEVRPDICSIAQIRPDRAPDGGNFTSRSFASPASRLSWEDYDLLMDGKSELSEIQWKVRQAEETGTANSGVPHERIYKVKEEEPVEETDDDDIIPASKPEPEEEVVHWHCGATTATGEPCKRAVFNPGDRCHWHADEEE